MLSRPFQNRYWTLRVALKSSLCLHAWLKATELASWHPCPAGQLRAQGDDRRLPLGAEDRQIQLGGSSVERETELTVKASDFEEGYIDCGELAWVLQFLEKHPPITEAYIVLNGQKKVGLAQP